jgi:protein SCO1/2
MHKNIVLLVALLALSYNSFAADAKRGEKTFSQRSCNGCHAVGTDGSATMGPNLAGVTKRQKPEWIKNWIKNPEKMLTDPTVVKLKEKYPASMPNMGLTDFEVDDLLAYLRSVDERGKHDK